jgi:hypothetical protein
MYVPVRNEDADMEGTGEKREAVSWEDPAQRLTSSKKTRVAGVSEEQYFTLPIEAEVFCGW